jgi:very-short-patch-repair endonuclease
LRRDATDAERKLWAQLRDRQLDGLKFKRQAPIGRFIADFACMEHHLIVEVDGGQHNFDANAKRDAERTAQLEAMGYVVLRFWNLDVLRNMDGVLTDILHELHRLDGASDDSRSEPLHTKNDGNRPEPPHPVPLPSGERARSVEVRAQPEPSTQTLRQRMVADEPTSPRPGGETDRVRGDRRSRTSIPSRGDPDA